MAYLELHLGSPRGVLYYCLVYALEYIVISSRVRALSPALAGSQDIAKYIEYDGSGAPPPERTLATFIVVSRAVTSTHLLILTYDEQR